jgi:Leucine-rich repeat (LRR) protein
MKITIYILAICFVGCQAKRKNIFDSFKGKSDVIIYLEKYKLDSVPAEVGILKSAKRLYINRDTSNGWTVYPPLSSLANVISAPPFRKLPDEITELTNLQSLTLINLDLVTLPDKIDRLKNLDSLILFNNKLTISKEIKKIKGLKNLKYLGILGNDVTANDLIQLKESNPNLEINPGLR